MTFITLHAGAGFAVYVRADQIRAIVQSAHGFFLKRSPGDGSDVTMLNGDTYSYTEEPHEILALIDNALDKRKPLG
jgi:hypothetical protein